MCQNKKYLRKEESMTDNRGAYVTGAVIGVLLVVAPWWITVSCAAIIIAWMVLKNDKPTQV